MQRRSEAGECNGAGSGARNGGSTVKMKPVRAYAWHGITSNGSTLPLRSFAAVVRLRAGATERFLI